MQMKTLTLPLNSKRASLGVCWILPHSSVIQIIRVIANVTAPLWLLQSRHRRFESGTYSRVSFRGTPLYMKPNKRASLNVFLKLAAYKDVHW